MPASLAILYLSHLHTNTIGHQWEYLYYRSQQVPQVRAKFYPRGLVFKHLLVYHWSVLSCHCCQVTSVMSDSVRPHRQQPTRLPRPWDSPGKNTGVGCHCLLQCTKMKSESEVTQSCLTLSDPMDCSLSGSSIHGIFQARVLEWGVIAFSVLARI